ncbi:MAG TPA: hypothetical protein VHU84_02335 [Lacipirellulaceae bacterium]|nr:hypothetical protein [Lacipirellulaceae bacterium]
MRWLRWIWWVRRLWNVWWRIWPVHGRCQLRSNDGMWRLQLLRLVRLMWWWLQLLRWRVQLVWRWQWMQQLR